jgi:exopolysaccharide production protein ExoQ
MNARRNAPLPEIVRHFFESPRFAAALTLVAIGTAFSTNLIRSLIGWPGLIGIIAEIAVLCAFSMYARRAGIEWHGLLPISIIVFITWSAISVFWSGYTWISIGGIAYQLAFAFLALYVGLVRDTIQIVRAVGDVLRVLLGVSIVVEVLSGLLLDIPIAFLGIEGNIAELGPIQGIFGSRNTLALVALIAGITFIVELRARSVVRGLGIGSLWLAAICLVLTRSPVIIVAALVVAIAALALYMLRRTAVEGRWMLQIGLLGATLVAGIAGWIARARIIDYLNAGSEFEVRITLWREMWRLVSLHPLEGWGWTGIWPQTVTPYGWLEFVTRRPHETGLNAFLDVYFQIGLVGFIAFVVLFGLALVRSWLLASNKRPVVFVWPALTLVVLLVVSAAESTVLVEFGWLLLLVCSVKAAQGMSWRSALPRSPRVDVN